MKKYLLGSIHFLTVIVLLHTHLQAMKKKPEPSLWAEKFFTAAKITANDIKNLKPYTIEETKDEYSDTIFTQKKVEVKEATIPNLKKSTGKNINKYMSRLKKDGYSITRSEYLEKMKLEPWKFFYCKITDDLLVVQLQVPSQKNQIGECCFNAVHYSSLFAKSKSAQDFMKKIWGDIDTTKKNIATIRKAFFEEKYEKAGALTITMWKKSCFKNVEGSNIFRLILDLAKKTAFPYPQPTDKKNNWQKNLKTYFAKDKKPLSLVLGIGNHVISGRLEWYGNIKVLFLADPLWNFAVEEEKATTETIEDMPMPTATQPKIKKVSITSSIQSYINEFIGLIDFLTKPKKNKS